MSDKTMNRIYRAATSEEKARHLQIRDQIDAELPDLKQRARKKLATIIRQGVELQAIVDLLKAERMKQGLTLAQLKEATGIEGATLARLEAHEDDNPTISTLTRYADAVGKKLLVVLAGPDDGIE